MTEHELEESSGPHGSPGYRDAVQGAPWLPDDAAQPHWAVAVRCRRCSREALSFSWAASAMTPGAREAGRAEALRGFLRDFPWDCDASLVEGVMRE